MRASVMLHLPALGLTKQIEKVFRALQKINLAVRGLYGEGSRAFGDLYQISNQVTLGKSEPKILSEIREVIPTILQYERQARTALLKERRQAEQDRVARAIGTLGSATMITAEETMELLSVVRLGIHLRLIDDIPATTVNQLFIHTQAAHLQKLIGHPLDGEERNARAGEVPRTGPASSARLGLTSDTSAAVEHQTHNTTRFAADCSSLRGLLRCSSDSGPGSSWSRTRSRSRSVRGIPTDLKFWLAKMLHAGAYAFLTVLACVAAGTPAVLLVRGRDSSLLHAIGTEIGQTYVPNRHGCVRDVVIDWVGIGLGIVVVLRWWSLSQRPSSALPTPRA